MPRDNRGVSLVEIVVVVAILAVLSAATVMGLGLVSGKPAEQCAMELKGALSSNRTVSLGKKDAKLVLSKQADGIHVEESYSLVGSTYYNNKVIAPKTVDVYYSTDGSSFTAIDASGITIEFDRSSGSLKNYSTDLYIRAIKSGKSYMVRVYQLTGKTIAEKE